MLRFLNPGSYRAVVGVLGVGWLVIAACYALLLGRNDRFMPMLPIILFVAAGVLTLIFVSRPESRRWFDFTGATTAAALFSRVISVIGGQWKEGDPDALPLTIILLIFSLILYGLYWRFWQREIRAWHEYIATTKRLESE